MKLTIAIFQRYRPTNSAFFLSIPLYLAGITTGKAAEFVVTVTADNGNGSLRQALAGAAANSEADTIRFAPALAGGTISLSTNSTYANLLTKYGPTGLVVNGDTVTLNGEDAPFLKISGANARRILAVTSTGNLTLKNLTFTGGKAQGGKGGDGTGCGHGGGGGAGIGGGVWVEGTLQVIGCTFSGNHAFGGNGGAPGGQTGFSGAGGGGGGFGQDGQNGSSGGAGASPGGGAGQNYGEGTAGTFGGGGGGGGGSAEYAPSSYGNGAAGGFGGGTGGWANVTVSSAPFGGIGNSGGSVGFSRSGGGGAAMGGAVFLKNGTCSLVNSTFYGNSATAGMNFNASGGSAQGQGGAVFNYQGQLSVLNCTIAESNITPVSPPNSYGISGISGATETSNKGSFSIFNTIIVSASESIDVGFRDFASGSLASSVSGNNAMSSAMSGVKGYAVGPTNLGALGDNGGPTATVLPVSGSSVIFDSGDATAAAGLTVDQRGQPRFAGNKIDIGAVQVTLGPPGIQVSAATVSGLNADLSATVTMQGASAVTARGFVWSNSSTNPDPLIGGTGVTRVVNGNAAVGQFSTSLTGLAANTAYTFKAYATNSIGTAYSGALTFTTNQAPTITSNGAADTASVTIPENTTAVATARATDADLPSQQISYSITGGADAARFAINASSGVLAFVQPPDFDIAGDANGDGTYDVIVQAADNGNTPRTDSQLISVRLSDLAEAPVVNTPTGAEITPVRATLGGTVLHDGGAGDAGTILERGVVYSLTVLNADPMLGGAGVGKSVSSGTTGVFSLAAIELSPGTSYTYRPYAINAQGVSYGPVATFTTAAGPALTGDVWAHYAGSASGVAGTTNGTGSAARFSGLKGITVDTNGDPFVADTLSHTIRKTVGGTAAVSTEIGTAGTSGSSDSAFLVAAKFNNPGAMCAFGPSSGTIKYYIADTGNHTIRLASWTFLGGWNTSTFAGTASSSGFIDATGAAARLRNPEGISTDSAGNVYVADTGNHAIRQIDSNKAVSTRVSSSARALTWGGSTSAWGSPAAGGRPIVENALSADIGETHMIVALANGTVDTWGGVVEAQEIPVGLSNVTRVAAGKNLSVALKADGSVVAWGRNSEGQATVPAGLSGVTAIDAGDYNVAALKSNGSVVVWGDATVGLNTVPESVTTVTALAMGAIHAVALKSNQTVVAWGNDYYGQTAVPAGLSGVTAIAAGTTHSLALKSDGTVVAWGHNSRGQCNVPAGLANVVSIAAGREFSLALKNDGTIIGWGSNAKGSLSIPADVLASGPTSLIAGSYHALAFTAPLKSPKGVASDAQGNLFIADTGNHVIRKYTVSTGVVSVFAGSVGQSGSADGLGTATRFNSPSGMTVDADGNVYVTDETDHTVRWITRDGVVRTLGGLAGTSGLANGAPEATRFKNPAGVASGSAALYVADTGNNRIVKGTPLFRPIIGTAGASDVTLTSVTLDGWVNPNGKTTTATFQYGLTTTYGSTAAATLASSASTSGQAVSAAISGLQAGTLYHYRLTASNADGSTTTVDGTFSTGSAAVFAATPVSSGITATAATLSGEVTSDGHMTLTERGIVYAATATNPLPEIGGPGVTKITTGGSTGTFEVAAANLNPGTAYSFRAYAINAAGTSYSNVALFTTSSASSPSQTWRQQYFGKIENTGEAADLATPDEDGIANLMKYALGLTPGKNGAGDLPKTRLADQAGSKYLSLTFRRDPSRNDVTIIVEAQANFGGTWTEIARSANGNAFTGPGGVTETNAAGGTKDVEIRDTQTIGSATSRFMRVRVVK